MRQREWLPGKLFASRRRLSSSLRHCKNNNTINFCDSAAELLRRRPHFATLDSRVYTQSPESHLWTLRRPGRLPKTMFDQQSQPNDRSKFLGQLQSAREERDRERRLNTAATTIQVIVQIIF